MCFHGVSGQQSSAELAESTLKARVKKNNNKESIHVYLCSGDVLSSLIMQSLTLLQYYTAKNNEYAFAKNLKIGKIFWAHTLPAVLEIVGDELW